jgi:hypothetical protein
VLVLAGLSVIGGSDVALGHGTEIVAGIGVATWLAHLFAELLGGLVLHSEPLGGDRVGRAMVDGSPILVATVLPATVLVLGRLDVLADATARISAIVIGVLQLFVIGVIVARSSPTRPTGIWAYALVIALVGVLVVALTVRLGH